MILFNTSKTIIKPVDEEMKQMHALDIRVESVFEFESNAIIPKEGKTVQAHTKILEENSDENGSFWQLGRGVYPFVAYQDVEMAENEAGWLVPRSSLTRNGVDVRSALYDAGYVGGLNGIFVVHNPFGIKIYKGARIGQFIVVSAETAKLYSGQYQGVKI